MEILKLVKSEIAQKFSVQNHLKDIILMLEKMAKDKNQVICKVKVNGLQLSEADELRFAETTHSEINEIEIELENVGELVGDAISSLKTYIDLLKAKTLRAADLFREQAVRDANTLFTDLISSAQYLTEALLSVKQNLQTQESQVAAFGEKWKRAEIHMMTAVKELNSAFENQDLVLVSDVLEYEISTSLDQWLEILSTRS